MFEITVTVTDNLEGQLVARVEHETLVFTNEFVSTPSLFVEKEGRLVNGEDEFTEVGDVIEFIVTATNTGDVPLLNVEIQDDKEGLYNVMYHIDHGDGVITRNVVNGQVTLQPLEKLVMVALYNVTDEDLEAEVVINTANAEGYEPDPFDPENPRDPDDPVGPVDPVRIEVPGERGEVLGDRVDLPQTGERTFVPFFSLAFITAGAYLVLKKRKEEE